MSSNERVKMNLASAVLVLVASAVAAPRGAAAAECQNQDTGITLSPGFCATAGAAKMAITAATANSRSRGTMPRLLRAIPFEGSASWPRSSWVETIAYRLARG